jgi:hypothetical protein
MPFRSDLSTDYTKVSLSRAHWDISLLTLQKFLSYGAVAGIGIFSTVLLILGLLWPWVERQHTLTPRHRL